MLLDDQASFEIFGFSIEPMIKARKYEGWTMKIWYNIGLCSQFAYKILNDPCLGSRWRRQTPKTPRNNSSKIFLLLSHFLDLSPINKLALHNFQHCFFTDLPERGEIPGLGIVEREHDRHTTIFTFCYIISLLMFLYLVLPVNMKKRKEKKKKRERRKGKRRFFERFTRSNDTRTNYSSSSFFFFFIFLLSEVISVYRRKLNRQFKASHVLETISISFDCYYDCWLQLLHPFHRSF